MDSERAGDRSGGAERCQRDSGGGTIRLLRFLFGLTAPVGRAPYALTGVGLMGLKYTAEAALIRAVTGRAFLPWQFLSPLMTTRTELLRDATWLLWPLVVWTLPFMWIGVALTLRRTADAGTSTPTPSSA